MHIDKYLTFLDSGISHMIHQTVGRSDRAHRTQSSQHHLPSIVPILHIIPANQQYIELCNGGANTAERFKRRNCKTASKQGQERVQHSHNPTAKLSIARTQNNPPHFTARASFGAKRGLPSWPRASLCTLLLGRRCWTPSDGIQLTPAAAPIGKSRPAGKNRSMSSHG